MEVAVHAPSRPMGRFEAFMESMQIVVAVPCIYTHAPTEPLDLERLRGALRCLIVRHPHLRVSVSIDAFTPSGCRFTVHPASSLDVPLEEKERVSESTWTSVAERIINEPLDSGHLRWKVIVLRGECRSEVLFVYSHAVADGLSGVIFHRDLMAYYAKLSAPEASLMDVLTTVEPLPFLISQSDALQPFATFTRRMVLVLLERFALSSLLNFRPLVTLRPQPPCEDRMCRCTFHEGTPEILSQLSARCKKEGITIGAFLHAIALFAYAQEVFARSKQTKTSLKISLPTNERNRPAKGIPRLGDDHIRFSVGFMELHAKISRTTPFWTFARFLHTKLLKQLRNGDEKMMSLAFGALLAHQSEALLRLMSGPLLGRMHDVAVSNIGRFLGDLSVGPLRAHSIYTVNNYGTHDANMLGGGDVWFFNTTDRLCLTVVWEHGVRAESSAESLWRSGMNLLENASTLSPSYTLSDMMKTE